jgi:hypothetical protein
MGCGERSRRARWVVVLGSGARGCYGAVVSHAPSTRRQLPRWLVVVSLLPGSAWAAICTVTTTADSSSNPPAGSLRACIQQANATAGFDEIVFDPAVFSPGIIVVVSQLPTLTDPAGVLIDGGDAQYVIIDGTSTSNSAGLRLSSDNNTVRNLTVRNFSGLGFGAGSGIYIDAGGVTNTFSHLHLYANTGGGMFLEGAKSGTVIRDSRLWDNGFAGVRVIGNSSPCDQRIQIVANHFHDNNARPSTDDLMITSTACVDVRANRFERNDYYGLRLVNPATVDAQVVGNTFVDAKIGIFSGARRNRIAFNRIEGNSGTAIAVGDTGSADNLVEGNQLVGTIRRGLYLYAGADRTLVFHNTFYGHTEAAVAAESVSDLRLHNNLLVGNGTGLDAILDLTWTVSHNGYFQNATDCSFDCAAELGAFFGDPGLAQPPADLSLGSCAAGAVDRGLDLGSLQPDLTGPDDDVRFHGQAPDLGALESNCPFRDPDAGTPDAGTLDAGRLDAGRLDAGTLDAGIPDGGDLEPPAPDAGVGPEGPLLSPAHFEVRCGCGAGPAGAGAVLLGVLGLLLRRARRPARDLGSSRLTCG